MNGIEEATGSKGKRVRFEIEDRDSNSDSDSDSSVNNIVDLSSTNNNDKGDLDYYDPIYFDSDEETDGSDDDDDNEEPFNKKLQEKRTNPLETSLKDITHGLRASTLRSPSPLSPLPSMKRNKEQKEKKKNRMRPTISDADLLYDPDEDDKDQDWLMKKIAAMFVENCRILENEILRFAKETKSPHNNNNKRTIKAATISTTTTTTASSTSLTTQSETSKALGSTNHFKLGEDDDANIIYHPANCEICNTKVAVVDQDEVYHFFNVIPTAV
ncbi:hypothetical protein BGZ65_001322 [Modicella reniformis]|uniref:Uncharacterized protein n=1 Tax=Modicella reniformis TaxID=1440133 RepID=A0A9P6SVI3_9FUNG|nr:hypothetical protein BGZ65_001322 [Modicella reniformis]